MGPVVPAPLRRRVHQSAERSAAGQREREEEGAGGDPAQEPEDEALAVGSAPLDALVHGRHYNRGVASFMGGSASAMASQIAEGYILLNPNTLRGYSPGDLAALRAEIERLQRDTRAITPPPDDAQANQLKNRKITRLSSALQVVSNKMMSKR